MNRMLTSRCRRCGQHVNAIRGYLHRVNEKGVPGIWECRPRCTLTEIPPGRLREPTQTQCPGCDRWRLNLRTDGAYECEKCGGVYALIHIGTVKE